MHFLYSELNIMHIITIAVDDRYNAKSCVTKTLHSKTLCNNWFCNFLFFGCLRNSSTKFECVHGSAAPAIVIANLWFQLAFRRNIKIKRVDFRLLWVSTNEHVAITIFASHSTNHNRQCAHILPTFCLVTFIIIIIIIFCLHKFV